MRRRVLPEPTLTAVLSRVQQRWRLRSLLLAIATGGAVFALVLIAAPLAFEASRVTAIWIALATGAAAAAWSAIDSERLSAVDAARAIESTNRSLDNLIVTAA